MNKKRILVVYGGTSAEHSVSVASGKMVTNFLDREKYSISTVNISKRGFWSFKNGKSLALPEALKYLQNKKYGIAFIALHGPFGEDGKIQSLFDSIGLKYTGSGASSSAISMDKYLSNQIAESKEFVVPSYKVFKKILFAWDIFPCVVKPVAQGSSYGTSIVKRKADLGKAVSLAFRHDKRVMVQKCIVGREITCGVLEKKGKAVALPPTEVIPKLGIFFDFKSKYKVGGSEEITPARLTKKQIREVQKYAVKAHEMLCCRGMSRSDFILKGGTFYYLETNTIPGLTKTSLLPQEAKAAGISFTEMLDLIISASL